MDLAYNRFRKEYKKNNIPSNTITSIPSNQSKDGPSMNH
jgi:hypothetical protein